MPVIFQVLKTRKGCCGKMPVEYIRYPEIEHLLCTSYHHNVYALPAGTIFKVGRSIAGVLTISMNWSESYIHKVERNKYGGLTVSIFQGDSYFLNRNNSTSLEEYLKLSGQIKLW